MLLDDSAKFVLYLAAVRGTVFDNLAHGGPLSDMHNSESQVVSGDFSVCSDHVGQLFAAIWAFLGKPRFLRLRQQGLEREVVFANEIYQIPPAHTLNCYKVHNHPNFPPWK